MDFDSIKVMAFFPVQANRYFFTVSKKNLMSCFVLVLIDCFFVTVLSLQENGVLTTESSYKPPHSQFLIINVLCSCGIFVVIDVPVLIQYYQLKFIGATGVHSWCSIVLEF